MSTIEQRSDEGRRRGVISLLAFVVLAAVMVDAGYLSYRSYEQRYRREMERQLSAIADLKVSVLTQWRRDRLGDGELHTGDKIAQQRLCREADSQPGDAG